MGSNWHQMVSYPQTLGDSGTDNHWLGPHRWRGLHRGSCCTHLFPVHRATLQTQACSGRWSYTAGPGKHHVQSRDGQHSNQCPLRRRRPCILWDNGSWQQIKENFLILYKGRSTLSTLKDENSKCHRFYNHWHSGAWRQMKIWRLTCNHQSHPHKWLHFDTNVEHNHRHWYGSSDQTNPVYRCNCSYWRHSTHSVLCWHMAVERRQSRQIRMPWHMLPHVQKRNSFIVYVPIQQ